MADDIQKSDKQTISFVTMRLVIPMSLIIVTPVGVASLGEYTQVAISWLVFLFDRFPYWQSATLHLMCLLPNPGLETSKIRQDFDHFGDPGKVS